MSLNSNVVLEIGQADWSLRRDGALDQKLRDELQDRMENNPQYKKMHTFRKKLPSYSMREVSTSHILIYKSIFYYIIHTVTPSLFE